MSKLASIAKSLFKINFKIGIDGSDSGDLFKDLALDVIFIKMYNFLPKLQLEN